MKKQKNFVAFYILANTMPGLANNKDELVASYTNGRTTHLREMTTSEYNAMITDLRHESPAVAERKRLRSSALRAMQRCGVDTSSWQAVDEFCNDKRIAGKLFRLLTAKELIALRKKCEAIRMKNDSKKLDAALMRARNSKYYN